MPRRSRATPNRTLVLFDIGGVLVRRPAIHSARAPRFVRRRARRGKRGGRRVFWSGFFDVRAGATRTRRRPTPGEAIPLGWRVDPEIARLALRLRANGVRTGVFSNIPSVPYAYVRARGWLEGFDPRLLAFRLGADKPDPAIFRSAGRRLPVDVARVVLVDDRADNVRAARAAGWDAIAFLSVPRLREALSRRGLLGRDTTVDRIEPRFAPEDKRPSGIRLPSVLRALRDMRSAPSTVLSPVVERIRGPALGPRRDEAKDPWHLGDRLAPKG